MRRQQEAGSHLQMHQKLGSRQSSGPQTFMFWLLDAAARYAASICE
jgi:hypothetical protein